MKIFNFTTKEIDAYKINGKEWHNFVRRREAEIIFSLFPDKKFPLALELGAGNGAQSPIIVKSCERLICTEVDDKSQSWLGTTILERKHPDIEYCICDAQDISRFENKTFDLIFSSNMLEYIPDLNKCLSECRRVLKNDGIMLHTMPSPQWKLFNFSLGLLGIVIGRLPKVQGVNKNHISEFMDFGCKAWVSKFSANNLNVKEIVALPFYVGYRNHFIPVTKAGNLFGLHASYLYVVEKP